jgi:hypothetical protein
VVPPWSHIAINEGQNTTYPCTAWVAAALPKGAIRGTLQHDNLLILGLPVELVHAHVENQAPNHLGDELEELARDTLARGEDRYLNVGAHEEHGRAEHGHGPGLAGTPRHDDQGLLLELLDPKLEEDALPVVFPLILVQLGQARSDVGLVELPLLFGTDNGAVPVIGEAVLKQVPELLDLLVAAESTGSCSLGLAHCLMACMQTTFAALLLGQHIVVGEHSIVDHGRGVEDHLAILLGRCDGRRNEGKRCSHCRRRYGCLAACWDAGLSLCGIWPRVIIVLPFSLIAAPFQRRCPNRSRRCNEGIGHDRWRRSMGCCTAHRCQGRSPGGILAGIILLWLLTTPLQHW